MKLTVKMVNPEGSTKVVPINDGIIDTVPLVGENGEKVYVQATPDVVTPPVVKKSVDGFIPPSYSFRGGTMHFHPNCFAFTIPEMDQEPITEAMLEVARSKINQSIEQLRQDFDRAILTDSKGR